MLATHTMKDLRLPTSEATAKAWGFVERSAMVFLGGLAPAEMGNPREVFAASTAETSMIADGSTEGETGTAGRPPGQGKSCPSSASRPVSRSTWT